tara:strand:- start:50131 stop:50994 length:864 start_codon:yes stop_codon:yes gene_type:complete
MKEEIGIIGNGFVGSAIAAGFSLHADVKVYDVDPTRSTHNMRDTINESNVIFVSVPTPMTTALGGEIDTSIMDGVFEQISLLNKRKDNIFVVKSTVIPGTVERYIDKYPELNIVFSPEFLTERAARFDFINSSRVILGGTKELTERVEMAMRTRFPYVRIIHTDVTTAQFIKYMANCFFATKVSFMNEMRQGADKLNVNWQDAMLGFITDGRIGNSHIDVPGHDGSLGFGGKCFPKDLNAFIEMFHENEVEPTVMKAVWNKNLEVRDDLDWTKIEGAVTKKKKRNSK